MRWREELARQLEDRDSVGFVQPTQNATESGRGLEDRDTTKRIMGMLRWDEIKLLHPHIGILDGVMRKLARLLLLAGAGPDPDSDQWYRASCGSVCGVCGRDYQAHVQHPLVEWLHVLCNGDLVKL